MKFRLNIENSERRVKFHCFKNDLNPFSRYAQFHFFSLTGSLIKIITDSIVLRF